MTVRSLPVSADACPRLSRFATAVRHWLDRQRDRRRNRREIQELLCLPCYLLRDMGLEHYAEPQDPMIRAHWR